MYSVATGIYIVLLLLEVVLLLVTWAQTHSTRAMVGTVLAALVAILLAIPDSTLLTGIARIFPGSAGLYLASLLYSKSKPGLIFYAVMILVIGFIGFGGSRGAGKASGKPAKKKH